MYLLDANIMIEAKNRYYAFDICPGFWDWLTSCHARGRAFSTFRVRDELLQAEDDLTTWVRTVLPAGFFINSGARTITHLRELSTWANESTRYTTAAKVEFLSSTDYYLVAQACELGFALVTHEIPSESRRRVKIPEAAGHLGVRVLSTYDVLRAEGARFS